MSLRKFVKELGWYAVKVADTIEIKTDIYEDIS